MGNDPLAEYRRERWQKNNMEPETGSQKPETGNQETLDALRELQDPPLTEHQALGMAIDALNEIPNRSLKGEYSNTYKLLPVLGRAYEEGKAQEKLTDAAPELLDALNSNSATLHMLWDLVADSPDGETIRAEVQAQLDKNNAAIAKATPAPASVPKQEVTREVDIEMDR